MSESTLTTVPITGLLVGEQDGKVKDKGKEAKNFHPLVIQLIGETLGRKNAV